jgi:hypothetical protein
MRKMLANRYSVIGVGAAKAESIGLATPEPGTIEALLTSSTSTAFAIPTFNGDGLPPTALTTLPTRSTTNPGYFPFSKASLTDFNALIVLNSLP